MGEQTIFTAILDRIGSYLMRKTNPMAPLASLGYGVHGYIFILGSLNLEPEK